MMPGVPVAPMLALTRASFSEMQGRVDPPGSMSRLTEARARAQMAEGEVWVIGPSTAPLACVFLTPDPPALHVGALAVDAGARRRGHARRLMDLAAERARAAGLKRLTLQTRIELVENHATFRRLGFTKTALTAHPGYRRATAILFERALG